MPSPFPGMDPFLEHPEIFPDLHDSLVTYTREWLQTKLPPPYYSVIGSRIWVEPAQRRIGPDVRVQRGNGNGSSTATAVAPATRSQPRIVSIYPEEQKQTLVEIYANQDNRERLVTVIELLSPSNKTVGAPGRESYVRKQQEILNSSQVHLVEIDLLRGGEHTTAVDFEVGWRTIGPYDYHVCIHRFDTPYDYILYPVRLTEKLPEIEVPLLPGDSPVALDIQAVFERCYDAGPYRRWVRYDGAVPEPALTPELAAWVRQMLQEKKQRNLDT